MFGRVEGGSLVRRAGVPSHTRRLVRARAGGLVVDGSPRGRSGSFRCFVVSCRKSPSDTGMRRRGGLRRMCDRLLERMFLARYCCRLV